MYNRLFLSFWFFFEKRKKEIYLNKISMFFVFQMATISTPITQEKVNKAKISIENFYANLINQHEEREERLEENLYKISFFLKKQEKFV